MPKRRLAFVPFLLAAGLAVAAPTPEKEAPARIDISVSPESVTAGGETRVRVQLVPSSGIKINRYPRIKLEVPAQEGLVLASEASVGNSAPPPAGETEANYFKAVDPVQLDLHLAGNVEPGRHEIPAKLTYYYCVAASGYCAPSRVQVKIPVTVR
jgi:hypothetical protein